MIQHIISIILLTLPFYSIYPQMEQFLNSNLYGDFLLYYLFAGSWMAMKKISETKFLCLLAFVPLLSFFLPFDRAVYFNGVMYCSFFFTLYYLGFLYHRSHGRFVRDMETFHDIKKISVHYSMFCCITLNFFLVYPVCFYILKVAGINSKEIYLSLIHNYSFAVLYVMMVLLFSVMTVIAYGMAKPCRNKKWKELKELLHRKGVVLS